MPPTRQLPHHFDEHFSTAGLDQLVRFRQAQENAVYKRRLREEVEELLSSEAPPEEIVERCQQHMATTSLSDVDVTVMVRFKLVCSFNMPPHLITVLLNLSICTFVTLITHTPSCGGASWALWNGTRKMSWLQNRLLNT